MKIATIACQGIRRELELFAPQDTLYLPQVYHDDPQQLNACLQELIDRLENKYPELQAILLCYPLCGGAPLGLFAKRVPIFIPKAHDCIDLLMACSKEFRSFRRDNPGSFYYTPSWVDFAYTPCKKSMRRHYETNAKRFGKEAAAFLSDENTVLKNYDACIYLSPPSYSRLKNFRYIRHTKKAAKYLGFGYRSLAMDLSILKNMVNGNFQDSFAAVPSGKALSKEDYLD